MGSTKHLEEFCSRLIAWIAKVQEDSDTKHEAVFNDFAVELFALQYDTNPVYRNFCAARGANRQSLKSWEDIPAAPTAAFKEFEMSCLPPRDRTVVFHSSGTSERQPSRHFHNAASLQVYEASLLPWFRKHFLPERNRITFLFLTPPASEAPHSSLVHMFESVRRAFAPVNSAFLGQVARDGSWQFDPDNVSTKLKALAVSGEPAALLGTAFSFVQLLDHVTEQRTRLRLPAGSRVFETGGYKGRSRALPKPALHALISERLGIPASHVVSEYGMSELSSQAYDSIVGRDLAPGRTFHFPPWARAQVVSPENGRLVPESGTGLLRIVDLANVYSTLAIQAEDLAVRRGDGFEIVGRATQSEPRGCSLMATA